MTEELENNNDEKCKWLIDFHCRRFPPVPIAHPSYYVHRVRQNILVSVYPEVGEDCYCGEWTPKKTILK